MDEKSSDSTDNGMEVKNTAKKKRREAERCDRSRPPLSVEQDHEQYMNEYNAYKQTEAYENFTKQQNEKKIKENHTAATTKKAPKPCPSKKRLIRVTTTFGSS